MVHFMGNPSVELQGCPCSRGPTSGWASYDRRSPPCNAMSFHEILLTCVFFWVRLHTTIVSRYKWFHRKPQDLSNIWGQQHEAMAVNWLKRAKMLSSAVHMGFFNMMLCGDFLAPGALFCCFCLLPPLHCASEAEGICLFIGLYTIITWGLWVILQ